MKIRFPAILHSSFYRSVLSVLLLITAAVQAQERQSYFYTPLDYGSEAMYNPLSFVLNGGYDIIQLYGHSRNIFRYDYGSNAVNVFRNLANPVKAISAVGWGRFLTSELLPINFRRDRAQWWPNYQLHLIGGGMSYVKMSEWYAAHGYDSPELWSAATMAVYHLVNEIVENHNYRGETADPVADIYFFDIGGILLFRNDAVKKFFSEELHLTDWSLQPCFTIPRFSLENNGQYFAMKWKLPFWDRWHLFYLFGMNGVGGLSYAFEDGRALSFGVGLRASLLKPVGDSPTQQAPDLVWNVAVYYDVHNSLLASLFISGLTYNTVNLNIYPGLFSYRGISPGVWLSINEDNSVAGGVTTRWAPGISFK
jgi:hypothetical protein